MHDIVIGAKSVQEARSYYGKEVLDYGRKKAHPLLEKLHFSTGDASAADPDVRTLSDEDLQRAAEEGKEHAHA